MGGDGESRSVSDGQILKDYYSERLEENVEWFRECLEEMLEAMNEDEEFSEMTAESYEQKKGYMRKHCMELTFLHTVLADQFACLIEQVRNKQANKIETLEQEVVNLNKEIETLTVENKKVDEDV